MQWPPLVFTPENQTKQMVEVDLKVRSNKRVKEGNSEPSSLLTMSKVYEEMGFDHNNGSIAMEMSAWKKKQKGICEFDWCNQVLHIFSLGKRSYESGWGGDGYDEEETKALEGIILVRVEEINVGYYDYPTFFLSNYEEKLIHRPWIRGVLVKLL